MMVDDQLNNRLIVQLVRLGVQGLQAVTPAPNVSSGQEHAGPSIATENITLETMNGCHELWKFQ